MIKSFFYDVDKYVQEESVILASILKWFFLSALIGGLVGVAAYVFLELLHLATDSASSISSFILLPLAFTVNMLIIRFVFPESDAYTTNKVIQRIHNAKKIDLISGVKAFFINIISIASGGSVGKEAPVADLGSSIGSMVASIFKLDPGDWRKLSICGISAGFSSVLGTPIAGAIFGVELLFIGSMLYEMLLPCLVAGITGYAVASALGAKQIFAPITVTLPFSTEVLFKILIAGVFFGFCSFLVIEVIKLARDFTRKFKKYSWLKSIIGGLLLATLAFFISDAYLGLGTETMTQALTYNQVDPLAFIYKIVFTAITLASGGIGGIIAPVLFVGSTAGHTLAAFLGLDVVVLAAIGMVAVLAGTTNTPIAASILAMELFGPAIAPYAAIACITSFLITGYRSIYPSQILRVHKTTSLKKELGKTIEETRIESSSYQDSSLARVKKMLSRRKNKGDNSVQSAKPAQADGAVSEYSVQPSVKPGLGHEELADAKNDDSNIASYEEKSKK
jgi:H+/Cl- antiporter ClcA